MRWRIKTDNNVSVGIFSDSLYISDSFRLSDRRTEYSLVMSACPKEIIDEIYFRKTNNKHPSNC